ncbi:response regulator [Pararobbsia alpina]|uniref:Regulator of RpoS n=1 Tax=Pararobbsia alpina TaxID=621374 RepID=A0A6S7BHU5_9BURK|nr:response regulator [Pararobbsia alpina]CAB3799261.1 Regulator of RpoS [Pararobbsia alpina]
MLTILVVDDEPDILTATRVMLTLSGFRVLVARDGTEAFRIASARFPHLILTDWMMPHMDGIELCRQLRKYFALGQIKVVLTSSANRPGLHPPLWDEFTRKPASAPELISLIHRLLHGQTPRLPANSTHIRIESFHWTPVSSLLPL